MEKIQSIIKQLINAKILDKSLENKALEILKNSSNRNVLEALFEKGLITKNLFLKIMSNQYSINFIEKIETYPKYEEIKIPIRFLKEYIMLPIEIKPNKITIATSNPANAMFQSIIKQFHPNKEIITVYAYKEDLLNVITKIEERFNLEKYKEQIEKELKGEVTITNEDSAAIKLIKQIIKIAVSRHTSDIHIEPLEDEAKIRFRIFGTLEEYTELDKDIYNALISRIKLLCPGMDVSEKRKPQDGAFSMKIDENEFDFRVSTLPTIWGESCVIRILDKRSILKKLDDIGISKNNLIKLKKSLKQPNGIFLVTGPTGSGKSTTLYASINEIMSPKNKIITVEDPVEYKLNGIQQVPVNPKIGMTFAGALRSILRQDPDIIMIGEIRDKETLEIAIKAALTGHLVISTLHTNNAISTINRMIDMGVQPFLIASALVGVEAQRLVKTNCPYCKEEYVPNKIYLDMLKPIIPNIDNIKFYKGIGCEKCNGTGYTGRTLITEIFTKTQELEEMIIQGAKSTEIEQYLKEKQGFSRMFIDGIQKAIDGITTVEEIFRIAKLEE